MYELELLTGRLTFNELILIKHGTQYDVRRLLRYILNADLKIFVGSWGGSGYWDLSRGAYPGFHFKLQWDFGGIVIAARRTRSNQEIAKMRYIPIICTILTATLAVNAQQKSQRPLQNNLGPAMPPSPSEPSSDPTGVDTVILSDVLGNDRSINIFAGFTRDFATMSQRFDDSALNTTILAPINSAIMKLDRKPWEDPKEYDTLGANAYEGDDGQERAQRNLRRFVEQHVVPASPWKEGEKLKNLAGDEIWWESKDGIKLIQPGKIEVSSVASRVHNGEVWILKGVRNYA